MTWQVKDFADGWIEVPDEYSARKLSAEQSGAAIRPKPQCPSWYSLSPFTQGYVEAVFASENDPAVGGFSDLAPETLARIIADCEEFAVFARKLNQKEVTAFVSTFHWGATFWNYRQADRWPNAFPPLTVELGDDGKVRFAS